MYPKLQKINTGQTLVELTLILPVLFLFIYFFIDMCLSMVEHDIAKYAAFTASRSYQVYGNAKIENEDKLVYKEAGRQVVELATPLIRKDEIEVVADSYYQGNPGEFIDRAEYDLLEKRYGFSGQGLLFKSREDQFSPAFGLLKVHYKRRPLFLAGIEIPGLEKKGLFDEMEVSVPYRLEERKREDQR